MSKKRAILAAGVGVAVGYLAKQQIDKNQKITPEKALNKAKEAFKKQGPISGSWIYMKPEDIEKNGLSYTVYHGGITRNIDGQSKQYEFHIDINTGTIIDVIESKS